MNELIFILFSLNFLQTALGKVVLLPDDRIEYCSEDKSGHFNYDNLHIEIVSDTEIFLNGSVQFLKEVKSPFIVKTYAEQYVRQKWVVAMFDRKIPDFCSSMKNPAEFWYNILKEQPGCPIQEGVSKKQLIIEKVNIHMLQTGRMEI